MTDAYSPDQQAAPEPEPEAAFSTPAAPEAPEDLALATQRLATLTPEALLEIDDYINTLEDQLKLPEAGGFCWVKMYTRDGIQVSFGDRATSSLAAMRRTMRAIRYGIDKYNLYSPNPQAPSPNVSAAAPIAASHEEPEFPE